MGSFGGFNFSKFLNTIYTVTISSLTCENVAGIVYFLQVKFKIGIILFMIFSLISKIFLQNLLIALMYQNYIETFNDDVEFIQNNYPKLGTEIKKVIIKKKLESRVLEQMVTRAYLRNKLDREFLTFHIFIEKSQEKVENLSQQQK